MSKFVYFIVITLRHCDIYCTNFTSLSPTGNCRFEQIYTIFQTSFSDILLNYGNIPLQEVDAQLQTIQEELSSVQLALQEGLVQAGNLAALQNQYQEVCFTSLNFLWWGGGEWPQAYL